jgi:hypothetical protein
MSINIEGDFVCKICRGQRAGGGELDKEKAVVESTAAAVKIDKDSDATKTRSNQTLTETRPSSSSSKRRKPKPPSPSNPVFGVVGRVLVYVAFLIFFLLTWLFLTEHGGADMTIQLAMYWKKNFQRYAQKVQPFFHRNISGKSRSAYKEETIRSDKSDSKQQGDNYKATDRASAPRKSEPETFSISTDAKEASFSKSRTKRNKKDSKEATKAKDDEELEAAEKLLHGFERKLKASWDLSLFEDTIEPIAMQTIPWPSSNGKSDEGEGTQKSKSDNYDDNVEEFLQQLTLSRAPAKLSSTPASQWLAVGRSFDWLALAQNFNISLNNTRFKRDPVFLLSNERDKGGMLGKRKDNLLMYFDTTFQELIMTSLKDKHYLYWTGELTSFEAALNFSLASATSSTAKEAISPPFATSSEGMPEWVSAPSKKWQSFKVVEAGMNGALERTLSPNEEGIDDEIWTPMLWISHPGVVAQTHYDTQHNFFIQLEGMKRMHIMAPSTDVSLFPNIHRSYRQSQISLERYNSSEALRLDFPSFFSSEHSNKNGNKSGKLPVWEVLVQPGDVIYIPPFWLHRVESLTFSVSLSVLSPSLLEAAFAKAYWHPVPFGAFQNSGPARILAASLYVFNIYEHMKIMKINFTFFPQFLVSLYLLVSHSIFSSLICHCVYIHCL